MFFYFIQLCFFLISDKSEIPHVVTVVSFYSIFRPLIDLYFTSLPLHLIMSVRPYAGPLDDPSVLSSDRSYIRPSDGVCSSVRPSARRLVRPSVHPSVRYIHPSIRPSSSISIRLSVLSIRPFVRPAVCRSVRLQSAYQPGRSDSFRGYGLVLLILHSVFFCACDLRQYQLMNLFRALFLSPP